MQVHVLTEAQISKIAEQAASKTAERIYNDQRWMRVNTVAAYTDVHRTTVLAWELPSSIIGGVRLYRKSDVDNFLMKHQIKRKLKSVA